MKAQTLSEVIRVFDPREPLRGPELAEFYVNRPGNPRDRMRTSLQELALHDQPVKLLFTGHSGSGKSTELNKLAEEIKSQFFIVPFAAHRSLNIADLTYVDLLLGMATSLFNRATEQEVIAKAPAQIAGDVWDDLMNFIERVIFGPASFRTPPPGKEGFDEHFILPNVKVSHQDGTDHREGLERLSEVISKRMNEALWVPAAQDKIVRARRDLAELAVLLRYAERGAWAFAVYNTVAVRDEVVDVLRALIAPIPVNDFTLTPERGNPLAYLDSLPLQARIGRAVVFFFDIERAGEEVWGYLELHREAFAEYPHGLVFWVTPAGRVTAVRRAPHFWAQRSGVFDFTVPTQPVLAELRGAWAGRSVWIQDAQDWERQFRLFTGLLREYEESGDAPPATLADLHGKVAYLLHVADRHDEAWEHLQAQRTLAEQAGDRRRVAAALNNLGRIERLRQGRDAALAYFEQALEAAGDEPQARADSLVNLADGLVYGGESQEALSMLNEALTLFRAVGARLGEANVLQAQGSAALRAGETDGGLALLEQARQLYAAVGDRVGLSNVAITLARHAAAQGDLAKAIEYMQPAADFCVEIKHPLGPQLQAAIDEWKAQLA